MSSAPAPTILVVTNETAEGQILHLTVHKRARALGASVTVVAPALNSRLHHWLSDEDAARAAAESRLARCLSALESLGVSADGRVGDADPIRAIADSVAIGRVDEIIIATHPEERSNWLARDLPARAWQVFGLPVVHVVVDVAAHREYLAAA
jgi:hypothetical protein